MKWLFAFLLAVLIFGSAAFFGYYIIVKPEMAVRAEQSGTAPEEPRVDVSLPEFQAAARLRQEGKQNEARAALATFLTKYPGSRHNEAAKDLLGEVNMQILLSTYPSPEKQEYIVKSGDVLARVAAKTKSTPELIMRTNNLRGTMLHIGDKLLVSHPEFSLFIQREPGDIILLNKGAFFKRYRSQSVKLPSRQSPRISTRVAEIIAYRDGKRVGFGTPEYVGSTRRVRLAQPGHVLYAAPSSANAQPGGVPPPPTGFAMLPADVEELSGLVNTKTPVTITD